MALSTFLSFSDPDAFFAGIRARHVEGVVTGRGDFHAKLTRVDFDELLMQRADERLPRVLKLENTPHRIVLKFATSQHQPSMNTSGLSVATNEIITWESGWAGHHRSTTASQWGSMSLASENLARYGEAITGRELSPPSGPRRVRPEASLMGRLLNLHEAACHLARTAPDIFAKPEVGQALEHALIEAMIFALATGEVDEPGTTHRRHARVMQRFEEFLAANSYQPLYMAEVCDALAVSYPTLRNCCQDHLGMSPKRYLWLRRMHLVRRALQTANARTMTVTEAATNCGFWELGRFSVTYHSLFGETPSATLHRPGGAKTGGKRGSAR